MANPTFPQGTFCWIELGTTDAASARKFYTSLFGWTTKDNPLPDGGLYSMCLTKGKEVGAFYEMDAKKKKSAPPHWLSYIAVTSADKTTAKAKSLGARAIMEPFDVMDVGRMALISDPTGATFALWEPKSHTGAKAETGEIGSFCWFELATNDTKKAATFYSSLFEWKMKTGGNDGYTEIYGPGKNPIGGMMAIKPETGDVMPHWMVYFAVTDCDATAKKAKALGGKWCVPPMDIPNVGRFSVFSDPQGAVFAVFQMEEK